MRTELWLCLLPMLALGASAKKRSLYDYFLEVPPELVGLATKEGKPLDLAEKRKLVKLRDDRNGYVLLDRNGIDGAESDVELALYLRKEKPPLVGMAFEFGDRTFLKFFTQVDGAWRDVSTEVLTTIDDEFLDRVTRKLHPKFPTDRKFSDMAGAIVRYRLPRKGTKIVASSLFEDQKVYGKNSSSSIGKTNGSS